MGKTSVIGSEKDKPSYHKWISVSTPTWHGIEDMIKDVVRTEIQTFPKKAKKEILVLEHIEKRLLKKWEEF